LEIKNAILSSKRFVLYISIVLVLLYMASGIYSVPQTQKGVHQRFGKIINPRVNPGIHYALPWPIDKIDKVPVMIVQRILIDDFSGNLEQDSIPYTFHRMTGLTPNCITGDNNIVNIICAVQYTVSNPVDYLFKVKDNERLLRDVVCNSIIKSLACLQVDEILTYGKRKVENMIKTLTQERLDDLHCGLIISFVELRDVRPPGTVQRAFDDVINAKIDRRKIVSQAESRRNEQVLQAKATATRTIEKARAYELERILAARGETKRFETQLETYRKTKNVTKKRLYFDFVKQVFPEIEKVYIVEKSGDENPAKIKIFSGDR
jgi:membrane protease subunit HflK